MNTAVKDVMTTRMVSVRQAGPGRRVRRHAGNDHRPAASQRARKGARDDAGDLMTGPAVTVVPEDAVQDAARLMPEPIPNGR